VGSVVVVAIGIYQKILVLANFLMIVPLKMPTSRTVNFATYINPTVPPALMVR